MLHKIWKHDHFKNHDHIQLTNTIQQSVRNSFIYLFFTIACIQISVPMTVTVSH